MSNRSSRPNNNPPRQAGARSPRALLLRLRRRKGGLLVIVAAGITVLVGMGALVCDVGLAIAQRTKMQMAADAAALAGASQIKVGETSAILEAVKVAKANGYEIQNTDIIVDPIENQVGVAWKEQTGFLLGPVLNRMGVEVGVKSVAGMIAVDNQIPLVPIIVPDKPNFGSIEDIKYCAGGGVQGNFGAAAVDGMGANVFYQSLKEGATTPLRTGMFVDTEPGNMVGPTDKAVAERINGDTTSYEDAVVKPNSRIVTLMLVDSNDFSNLRGRKPIMIRAFARFYIISSTNGNIRGRFIDRTYGNNVPPPQETRVKLVR